MQYVHKKLISSYVKKGKGKVIPLQARCGPEGGQRYSSTLPRPRHQKVVSGQQHAPAALNPRERPDNHCTGGWVGLRAGLNGRKISSPSGFNPGPSRPVSVTMPTELPGPLLLMKYMQINNTSVLDPRYYIYIFSYYR